MDQTTIFEIYPLQCCGCSWESSHSVKHCTPITLSYTVILTSTLADLLKLISKLVLRPHLTLTQSDKLSCVKPFPLLSGKQNHQLKLSLLSPFCPCLWICMKVSCKKQGEACSPDFLLKDKRATRHFSTSFSIPFTVDLYKLVSTTVVNVCAMCMRVYACALCTHDTGNLCKNLNHLYLLRLWNSHLTKH